MLNFGRKLRHMRQQCNLTQAALAAQLGLTTNTFVSKVERGEKSPPLDLIVRVAVLFGVSTRYLLEDAVPIEQPIAKVWATDALEQMNARTWGQRIRTLRVAQNRTQIALAAQLNLTSSSISHIEAGRKQPSPAVLVRLADALGVTVDDLLGAG